MWMHNNAVIWEVWTFIMIQLALQMVELVAMPGVKAWIAVSVGIQRIFLLIHILFAYALISFCSFDIFPPCPSTATTQAPTQPTTAKSTTTKTTTTRDPNDTRPRII